MITKASRTILLVLAVAGPACSAPSSPASEPAAATTGITPHEPLNPKSAQALPEAPLVISSGAQSHRFTVELADDDDERSIGLMHRAKMSDDHGMLFDFQTPRRVGFWMRNTFIPLDMIFIKSDGEIVSISENIQPHNETPVGPARPVRAVLELNAGLAKKLGLKVGDIVRHAVFNNGP